MVQQKRQFRPAEEYEHLGVIIGINNGEELHKFIPQLIGQVCRVQPPRDQQKHCCLRNPVRRCDGRYNTLHIAWSKYKKFSLKLKHEFSIAIIDLSVAVSSVVIQHAVVPPPVLSHQLTHPLPCGSSNWKLALKLIPQLVGQMCHLKTA